MTTQYPSISNKLLRQFFESSSAIHNIALFGNVVALLVHLLTANGQGEGIAVRMVVGSGLKV